MDKKVENHAEEELISEEEPSRIYNDDEDFEDYSHYGEADYAEQENKYVIELEKETTKFQTNMNLSKHGFKFIQNQNG